MCSVVMCFILGCPEGWYSPCTMPCTCYHFLEAGINRAQAIQACDNDNAHLLEIDNECEMTAIQDLVNSIPGMSLTYMLLLWLAYCIGGYMLIL